MRTTFPFQKILVKTGVATGVQSAATSKSAWFRKGAVGGISLIWTGQWQRADAGPACDTGSFAC